jgi:hypothetical protein
MNKITLAQAYHILQTASAVIWGDHFLCYPSLSELTGEDDNEFLFLSINDSEGLEFSARFAEGNNKEACFMGTSLFLQDTEGDEVQITILSPVDVLGLLPNKVAIRNLRKHVKESQHD